MNCMTLEEQEAVKQEGYAEAMRYIANAKDALANSGIDGNFYTDKKYVRSASGIAYSGVLEALDTFAEINKKPKPQKGHRKSVDFYRDILSYNQTLRRTFDAVYNNLHLSGYYDGNTDSTVIKAGFKYAKVLIDLIKPCQEAA